MVPYPSSLCLIWPFLWTPSGPFFLPGFIMVPRQRLPFRLGGNVDYTHVAFLALSLGWNHKSFFHLLNLNGLNNCLRWVPIIQFPQRIPYVWIMDPCALSRCRIADDGTRGMHPRVHKPSSEEEQQQETFAMKKFLFCLFSADCFYFKCIKLRKNKAHRICTHTQKSQLHSMLFNLSLINAHYHCFRGVNYFSLHHATALASQLCSNQQ